MENNLPPRPNLDHLRSQAKALLTALRAGDPSAAQTIIDHLPEARGLSHEQVVGRGFRLADVQSALARKTGFGGWPALTRHIEQLRSLEGTWEFARLEVDGTEVPVEALAQSRLLIDGDRFRMESPEAIYEGIFNIDVDQKPAQIDIEFVEGPEAGNWSYGLFTLVDDDLTICIGLTGAPRPTDFLTTPQSGHALEYLRRSSATRPDDVTGGSRDLTPKPQVQAFEGEFESAMTPLLERLQGEWTPVELTMDGNSLPPMMLKMGSRTSTGTETKVVFGGQVMVHAKVRIDESVTPFAVDYLNLGGPSKGTLSFGIMRWVGEDCQFCMAPPGAARPTDFSCDTGSKRTTSRWKRKT